MSLESKPLTFNLMTPILTFSLMSVACLVMIGVHYAYIRFGKARRQSELLKRYILEPIGTFRIPADYELWLVGFAGLICGFIFSASNNKVEYGDVFAKFMQGFSWLYAAPLLIPFKHLLLGESKTNGVAALLSKLAVGPYFLLIVISALAKNSRGAFSEAILLCIIFSFLAIALNRVKLDAKFYAISLAGLALVIPMFIFTSNLSMAILATRYERKELSTSALIRKSFDTMGNEAAIEERKRVETTTTSDYNEVYANSEFINRFSVTKFVDLNILAVGNVFSPDPKLVALARKNARTKILGLLPSPFLGMLGINLNKADLAYSTGDFYQNYASRRPLGGYITGSSLVDGLVLFGFLEPFVFGAIFFIFFAVIDSFTKVVERGQFVMTAMIAMCLVSISVTVFPTDSFANIFGYVTRTLLQEILIYSICFGATDIIFNKTLLKKIVLRSQPNRPRRRLRKL